MASQTLSLSQSQRQLQILAPQLRQSLEMLQLPMLELRAMIQQEIEQNPTIEEALAPEELTIEELAADVLTPEELKVEARPDVEPDPVKEPDANLVKPDFDKEYEVLAKLDDEWRDYFFQDAQAARGSSEDDEDRRSYFMDSQSQRESLQEHLVAQMSLAGLSETDRQLGELLIGSINDDGYLTAPLADLAASSGADVRHLEDVLTVIQEFHPIGVGARDLKECLMLQIERGGREHGVAVSIILHHLGDLAARKYKEIAKALKVTVDDVIQGVHIISNLNPKPGQAVVAENAAIVVPEVEVQRVDGKYVVVMDEDQLPHVRISTHYRKLMEDPATAPDVRAYVQEKIRAGAFLIKSIYQRQKTIQRIAAEVVSTQTEFLDHGVSHLKPLTMSQIAQVVGVHETTVSRAVSGKYMQTPIGIFELKYFFTPGIKMADGSEVSNKTVRDMISTMVSAENAASPLADQEIVARLAEQGINIARRTAAKYRLILHIPPSHLRKVD
jgi:RNA polymerase sigma-54 factor